MGKVAPPRHSGDGSRRWTSLRVVGRTRRGRTERTMGQGEASCAQVRRRPSRYALCLMRTRSS
jgi:hypothetical protein